LFHEDDKPCGGQFAEVAAGGLRRHAGGISKLGRGQRAPAELFARAGSPTSAATSAICGAIPAPAGNTALASILSAVIEEVTGDDLES
jgi:hypothetical protein